MEQANETLKQEIASLEQQIREKRAALGPALPEGTPEQSSDRELLHQALGGRINQAGQQTPSPAAPAPDDVSQGAAVDLQTQVQQFVNIAFTKSVDEAIREIVKTGSAALIDAFHDTLTDQLYQELVSRKKIDQPA